MFDFVYRYSTVGGQSASDWESMREICITHRLSCRDIDNFLDFERRREELMPSSNKSNHLAKSASRQESAKRVDEIFASIDFSQSNDISIAYRRFEQLGGSYDHQQFFAETCDRVTVGQEAEFIAAFREVPDFELYHLRHLIEQIPDRWRERLAVKASLAQTLKSFCRRYCMQMLTGRDYEVVPLGTGCEMADIAEDELTEGDSICDRPISSTCRNETPLQHGSASLRQTVRRGGP